MLAINLYFFTLTFLLTYLNGAVTLCKHTLSRSELMANKKRIEPTVFSGDVSSPSEEAEEKFGDEALVHKHKKKSGANKAMLAVVAVVFLGTAVYELFVTPSKTYNQYGDKTAPPIIHDDLHEKTNQNFIDQPNESKYSIPQSVLLLEQKARRLSADDFNANVVAYQETKDELNKYMKSVASQLTSKDTLSPEFQNFMSNAQEKFEYYTSKIELYSALEISSPRADRNLMEPFTSKSKIELVMPKVGVFWGYELNFEIQKDECLQYRVDISDLITAIKIQNQPVIKQIQEIDQGFEELNIAAMEAKVKESMRRNAKGPMSFNPIKRRADELSVTPERICLTLIEARLDIAKEQSFEAMFSSVHKELMSL